MMKTTMNVRMAMMAFAVMSVWAVNAAKPIRFSNWEMDNNRVKAEIVYKSDNDGQSLTPEYRFEFSYNTEGKVAEKKALKWNGTRWVNYYCITVSYTATEAHMQYAVWNKTSKKFSPAEKYIYQLAEAEEFLMHRS